MCLLIRCLLVLPLLLLVCRVQGQEVLASQEINLNSYDELYLLGRGEKGLFLYAQNSGRALLSRYDEQLRQLWERKLDLPEYRARPLGATIYQQQLTLYYTYRKNSVYYLKQQRYSLSGLPLDSVTLTPLEGEFAHADYEVYTDKTFRYVTLFRRGSGKDVRLIGLDATRSQPLYSRVLSEKKGALAPNDDAPVYIDQDGYTHILAERNNLRFRREEHRLIVHRISPRGQVEKATLSLEGELTYDAALASDYLNDQLIVAGYYTHKGRDANGIFTARLPRRQLSTQPVVLLPFSDELLLDVETDQRSPQGIGDLVVRDIKVLRNGTAVIWGEQQQEYVRARAARSGYLNGSFKTEFIYRDILISAITPDGTVAWQQTLPKRQVSQDDGAAYSGFFLASSPEAVRLIFNDEVRQSGGTVSAYTVNGAGEVRRRSLLNTSYRNLQLRPEGGHQLGARTVIIPSQLGGRFRLVRVEF